MNGLHNLLEKEEKRVRDRRRHLLHLISSYLENNGYIKSSDVLALEAQLSDNIQVCDNMDLEMILTEYDNYYNLKFNKHPILCKKAETTVSANSMEKKAKATRSLKQNENKNANKREPDKEKKGENINDINLAVTVKPVFSSGPENQPAAIMDGPEPASGSKTSVSIDDLYPEDSEFRKIAETISKEIVMKNLNVHWDDIKGLADCKVAIKEAIVYPIKYPIFFRDKFTAWKGILLYGAPGTGKTMLAKATATECNCTFFNISASSLVSKWRGDSEKYLRTLFDVAYQRSPAIIFIDEIDWIATDTENGPLSEPARRFRAELLARLDGLISDENANVVLLAATNSPWIIDAALLRRLEKHIYVPLPNKQTRLDMLNTYACVDLANSQDLHNMNVNLNHYSGSDIKMLCKQAWILQVTPTIERLENKEISILDVPYEIASIDHLEKALELVKPTIKNKDDYLAWIAGKKENKQRK
ncbi:PREDICTED: katanin p60 ATPase-containing subunit A-like 2 [Dufourea novaeangliae]|uniref:katanin p60 ATPase-containing subunit A-like 2 n=1 Tax=Dufourea novaeangliae TaxID=178035 RepID=UPI00076782AF|nr:PREDICTED: katanin p60 ATPase-containing subunit A-like 2 [Dufourea novaeangliae]